MSIETRAYDKPNNDGFPPDPVVVLVATGTTDVSRLVYALARGNSEQVKQAEHISRQLRRHNAGRAALSLLKQHGGLDFTEQPADDVAWKFEQVCRHLDAVLSKRDYADTEGLRGGLQYLKDFIRGLEFEAKEPHFPEEPTA